MMDGVLFVCVFVSVCFPQYGAVSLRFCFDGDLDLRDVVLYGVDDRLIDPFFVCKAAKLQTVFLCISQDIPVAVGEIVPVSFAVSPQIFPFGLDMKPFLVRWERQLDI